MYMFLNLKYNFLYFFPVIKQNNILREIEYSRYNLSKIFRQIYRGVRRNQRDKVALIG